MTPRERDLAEQVAGVHVLAVLPQQLLAHAPGLAEPVRLERAEGRLEQRGAGQPGHGASSVTAAADTLLERADELDDETRSLLLESVARNARRLDRLVEDLLIVGQLDSGALTFEPADIRIDVLVREARETCEQVGVAVRGGPPVTVHADPMRVYQILCNLAMNAATHGAAPIEMSWRERDHLVEIDIVDHGGGISEEDAVRAFERFAQLGSSPGHREGAGLGLPIARDLARAMGGDVTLSSHGSLTVARLTLPRSREAAADDAAPRDLATSTPG